METINAQIFCYLTLAAEEAVKDLMSIGLDVDLALAVLEQLWPESEIYDLEGAHECT